MSMSSAAPGTPLTATKGSRRQARMRPKSKDSSRLSAPQQSLARSRHKRDSNPIKTSDVFETPLPKPVTELSDWVIKPVPDFRGVCVEGQKRGHTDFWHSTAIAEVISPNKVQTTSGSVYVLKGKINKLCTIENGFTKDVAKAFSHGFPKNWKDLIEEFYKVLETSISEDKLITSRALKNMDKNVALKEKKAKSLNNSRIVVAGNYDQLRQVINNKSSTHNLVTTRSGRHSLAPLGPGQWYNFVPGTDIVTVEYRSDGGRKFLEGEAQKIVNVVNNKSASSSKAKLKSKAAKNNDAASSSDKYFTPDCYIRLDKLKPSYSDEAGISKPGTCLPEAALEPSTPAVKDLLQDENTGKKRKSMDPLRKTELYEECYRKSAKENSASFIDTETPVSTQRGRKRLKSLLLHNSNLETLNSSRAIDSVKTWPRRCKQRMPTTDDGPKVFGKGWKNKPSSNEVLVSEPTGVDDVIIRRKSSSRQNLATAAEKRYPQRTLSKDLNSGLSIKKSKICIDDNSDNVKIHLRSCAVNVVKLDECKHVKPTMDVKKTAVINRVDKQITKTRSKSVDKCDKKEHSQKRRSLRRNCKLLTADKQMISTTASSKKALKTRTVEVNSEHEVKKSEICKSSRIRQLSSPLSEKEVHCDVIINVADEKVDSIKDNVRSLRKSARDTSKTSSSKNKKQSGNNETKQTLSKPFNGINTSENSRTSCDFTDQKTKSSVSRTGKHLNSKPKVLKKKGTHSPEESRTRSVWANMCDDANKSPGEEEVYGPFGREETPAKCTEASKEKVNASDTGSSKTASVKKASFPGESTGKQDCYSCKVCSRQFTFTVDKEICVQRHLDSQLHKKNVKTAIENENKCLVSRSGRKLPAESAVKLAPVLSITKGLYDKENGKTLNDSVSKSDLYFCDICKKQFSFSITWTYKIQKHLNSSIHQRNVQEQKENKSPLKDNSNMSSNEKPSHKKQTTNKRKLVDLKKKDLQDKLASPLKKKQKHDENGLLTANWTEDELRQFQRAKEMYNSADSLYWFNVAEFVGSRSVVECLDLHRDYLEAKTSKNVKHSNKMPAAVSKKTGREKGDPIRGKKGTLKRKQEVREFLDELNEGYEDNLFEGCTPFVSRKANSSVFNIDFSKDDSEVFGKNHNFFTPVHSRDVSQPGTELRVGLTSAMKVTPAAPPGSLTDTETPLVVHRNIADKYIKSFMDRKKKSCHSIPKEADLDEIEDKLKDSAMPFKSLFSPILQSGIIFEQENDNDDDDDEGDPYYWEDAN